MADGRATEGEEDDDATGASAEPPFPCLLPAGLRQDWPAPRQAVLGPRDGAWARVEAIFARAVVGGLSRLPTRVRDALAGGLARIAKAADRSRSDSAREFLRQALGAGMDRSELESRVLQAWRHLFRVALDSEAFSRAVPIERIREHFEVEACEDARRLLASRRGCILVTAHVGDWEAGAAILPWIGLDPLYAVSKPPMNRPLAVHAQRIRERRGVRLLPRRGAMRDAPAVVRAGGTLGLMLDQRARKRPVVAPFFGRPARCDRGAGVLVKRLGAPILVMACYRTGRPWRWRLCLPAVLWPEDLRGLDVAEIVGRVNAELEKTILAAPDQYFWLHDRYRGAP